MIYKGKKEVGTIYIGSRPLYAIYRGSKLVWQAIRSCFGNGYWVNAKPWLNTEGWKN